jgi:putative flippase GtrA
MSLARVARFNVASLLGVPVQLAALWLLVRVASIPYVPATALAVGIAVGHNFWWHWHWTWADRSRGGPGAADAFLRFAAANGAVSLAGNLLVMPLLVGWAAVPLIPSNLGAVAVTGCLNFWLADHLVFRGGTPSSAPALPGGVDRPTAGRHETSRPGQPRSCVPLHAISQYATTSRCPNSCTHVGRGACR